MGRATTNWRWKGTRHPLSATLPLGSGVYGNALTVSYNGEGIRLHSERYRALSAVKEVAFKDTTEIVLGTVLDSSLRAVTSKQQHPLTCK